MHDNNKHLSSPGIGAQRFAWESQTRPLVEQVLKSVFPTSNGLRWTADSADEIALDRLHGIDIILEFPSFMELSVQAKVLNTDYRTITIETTSTADNSLGDWSDCRADYLVVLYSDGELIHRYTVLNRVALTLATNEGRLKWQIRHPKPETRQKSSFKWITFEDIMNFAPECVVAHDGNWYN